MNTFHLVLQSFQRERTNKSSMTADKVIIIEEMPFDTSADKQEDTETTPQSAKTNLTEVDDSQWTTVDDPQADLL